MLNIRRSICVISILAMATMPVSAAAIRTFPGFQPASLPKGDDVSSSAIPLGFMIGSLGWSSSSVYIDTNGAITFNAPYVGYPGMPEDNYAGGVIPPISSSVQPIISAFLEDIDTSAPAVGTITYGATNLNGRPAFVVTYSNVTGYSFTSTDFDRKHNSFQIVLVERSDTGPGNFDIELNYDRIEWEAADSNGGESGFGGYVAVVGYSNGSGVPGTFYELPGSGVPGSYTDGAALSLVAGSQDSGVAGRYSFAIRNTTAPVITSLTPATILSNSQGFTLSVNGSGFAPNSVVLWNGLPLPTVYANPDQLTALVVPGLVASQDVVYVTVNTGGSASKFLVLSVVDGRGFRGR